MTTKWVQEGTSSKRVLRGLWRGAPKKWIINIEEFIIVKNKRKNCTERKKSDPGKNNELWSYGAAATLEAAAGPGIWVCGKNKAPKWRNLLRREAEAGNPVCDIKKTAVYRNNNNNYYYCYFTLLFFSSFIAERFEKRLVVRRIKEVIPQKENGKGLISHKNTWRLAGK